MPRMHLIRVLFNIIHTLVLFALLFLNPAISIAGSSSNNNKQKNKLADHLTIQSGGYLGYVALGAGKNFGRHNINMLIGYVPENVGGVEIIQLDFKYDWHPSQLISLTAPQENISIDPFYIGLSIIYGSHDELFIALPEKYPEDYYPPTALRYTLNVGAALQYGKQTYFIEYSALDVGLVSYINNAKFFINNYDYLGLEAIGSLAIGIKFEFE